MSPTPTTSQLWAFVRAQERIGAEPNGEPSSGELVEEAMQLVATAISGNVSTAIMRSLFTSAYETLAHAQAAAIREGADAVGYAIEELMTRVGAGLAHLGDGAGAAVEGVLGQKPADAARTGMIWIFALGALVLFAPGGPAVVAALGRSVPAIARAARPV